MSPNGADKGAVAGIQHILAVQASSQSNTRVQQIQIHVSVKYTCPTFFFYLQSARLHAVTTSASGRLAGLLVNKVLMWLFKQYGPIDSSLTENFPLIQEQISIISTMRSTSKLISYFKAWVSLQFWYSSRSVGDKIFFHQAFNLKTKWVDDSPDDDDVTAKSIEWTGRVGSWHTCNGS